MKGVELCCTSSFNTITITFYSILFYSYSKIYVAQHFDECDDPWHSSSFSPMNVRDWQPLPFYSRPGAYLLDSPTESSWYKLDRWRHSWESGKSNLVCGIPSRIPVMNDCDVLQTRKCWALVTDAKESMDSIPTWLRTDRWLAVLWQSMGTFSLRGWDVAIDNGDALRTACHGKE